VKISTSFYYLRKVFFGFLLLAMYQAILTQSDKILYILHDPDASLPLLTRCLGYFVPETHIAMSVSSWLISIIGFLSYTKLCSQSHSWLISFTTVVVCIWSMIAADLPFRILLRPANLNKPASWLEHLDETLWILLPSLVILAICTSRYQKEKSIRSILG
jgi:hypothetical protein